MITPEDLENARPQIRECNIVVFDTGKHNYYCEIRPRFLMSRCDNFWFGTTNKELGPMVDFGPKGPPFTCLGHYEESTGKLDVYYAGPNSTPEEPYFVPKRPDSPEGDGWLLSVVGRRGENRTDLVILDARELSAGPVATLKMPCRIHEGFHGIWVPRQDNAGHGGDAPPN